MSRDRRCGIRARSVALAACAGLAASIAGGCGGSDSGFDSGGGAADASPADARRLADGAIPDAKSWDGAVDDAAMADGAVDDAAMPDAPAAGWANFTWTIDGEPATLACGVGGQVTIEVTSGPTSPASTTTQCSVGSAQLAGLAPGSYVFRATLAQGGDVYVVDNITAELVATQMTTVANIDFQVGATAGTASFTWTIEGGAKQCSVGSSMTVTVVSGPDLAANVSGDCFLQPLTLPFLAVGQYVFELTLDSGLGSTTTTSSSPVDIVAGSSADVAVDFESCSFCP